MLYQVSITNFFSNQRAMLSSISNILLPITPPSRLNAKAVLYYFLKSLTRMSITIDATGKLFKRKSSLRLLRLFEYYNPQYTFKIEIHIVVIVAREKEKIFQIRPIEDKRCHIPHNN